VDPGVMALKGRGVLQQTDSTHGVDHSHVKSKALVPRAKT
jgi:hypothetical protein